MLITLTPEQEAWLQAHVARGDFASIEEAPSSRARSAMRSSISWRADDLAWAKPMLMKLLPNVARGDVITLEEHEARNDARLASMS